MSARNGCETFDQRDSKELIKRGKKQKGDSVEARGNRWRITGGKSQWENRAAEEEEESGSPGGRKEVLVVRVSLMKHR